MKNLMIVFLILITLYQTQGLAAQKGSIEIMSYNVENLFDNLHDEGKNDWAYLPKDYPKKFKACQIIGRPRYRKECFESNWNDEKIDLKLNQIKRMVESVGKRPDILALVEVENDNIVGQLAKKLGYTQWVISDGPDKRGISVALLYNESEKLKFIDYKEHRLFADYFKIKPTRNILEVKFLINQRHPMTILVNHWPSQANPASVRGVAALKIRQIIKRNTNLIKENFIVLGDFNTIKTDCPHPFDSILLKDDLVRDIHTTFHESKKVPQTKKDALPPASYYYSRNSQWNLLDRFFVSNNLLDSKGLDVELADYKIIAPEFATKLKKRKKGGSFRVPKRYNRKETDRTKQGFSDHFPIFLKLSY